MQVKWMIIKIKIFSETHKSVIWTPFPEEDPAEVNYLTRKKFLGEKTMIKNFFKYKRGVGHYHFGAKAYSEMIDYTFLLPGKNDFLIEGLRISCEISNNIFLYCYISNSYKMTRRPRGRGSAKAVVILLHDTVLHVLHQFSVVNLL